jgi:DNA-binding transcriptional ArsR family regulator/rhodanese-related sulfurtransferase
MKKTMELARQQQDHIFNELAKLMGALGSPVRLKIFHFLTQAPHSVEQLADKLNQSIANTSMHLKKLQREGLLKAETMAQKRVYSLAHTEMKNFWEQILAFSLIQNPENDFATESIYGEELNWDKSLEETIKLITAKKVVLLDVRPLDEIDSEDILYHRYVLSIPASELKQRQKEILGAKPILVMCRGRLCVLASEVTANLRDTRKNVYRLPFSWHQLATKLLEV